MAHAVYSPVLAGKEDAKRDAAKDAQLEPKMRAPEEDRKQRHIRAHLARRCMLQHRHYADAYETHYRVAYAAAWANFNAN